jgi:RNA polymerase sigma factor (sigma-70 family)
MINQSLTIDDDLRDRLFSYFHQGLHFDSATADDLAQETWIRAQEKKLSSNKIFGVAAKLALEKWRAIKQEKKRISNLKKTYKERSYSDDLSQFISQKEEDELKQQEILEKLEKAYNFLECLTEEEKYVYIQKKVEGRPLKQIADELHIEYGNVRQRLHRALIKLGLNKKSSRRHKQ